MIEMTIPGRGILRIDYLVCDVNGTLTVDGKLVDSVTHAVTILKDRLTIHLLTADTFGTAALLERQLGVPVTRLVPGGEAQQKLEFITRLGCENVAAIGQGANDELMLKSAAIGICVLSREGAAASTIQSADLVVPDIQSALELLEKPLRLVATLRI